MQCPEYTETDAMDRWGAPSAPRVYRACPWCASWLSDKGRGEGPFPKVAECVNLACPMLPTGGCYWEPLPDGWTEEAKRRWNVWKINLMTLKGKAK